MKNAIVQTKYACFGWQITDDSALANDKRNLLIECNVVVWPDKCISINTAFNAQTWLEWLKKKFEEKQTNKTNKQTDRIEFNWNELASDREIKMRRTNMQTNENVAHWQPTDCRDTECKSDMFCGQYLHVQTYLCMLNVPLRENEKKKKFEKSVWNGDNARSHSWLKICRAQWVTN